VATESVATASPHCLADGERRKVISTVRRWINEARQSRCLPQPQRFVIAVVDARRALYSVVGYVDHVLAEAASAVDRSKRRSLAPLDRRLKELESQKLDELSDERRQQIENEQQELEVFRARMAEVCARSTAAGSTCKIAAVTGAC
jgi:hypothetical protein